MSKSSNKWDQNCKTNKSPDNLRKIVERQLPTCSASCANDLQVYSS